MECGGCAEGCGCEGGVVDLFGASEGFTIFYDSVILDNKFTVGYVLANSVFENMISLLAQDFTYVPHATVDNTKYCVN